MHSEQGYVKNAIVACPDENELLAYLDGQLTVQADKFRSHFARCRECRALVAALARASRGENVAAATGDVIGGRYELREIAGSGSMAIVYRGWDRELDRPVAIKLLRGDEWREKMEADDLFAEARLVASLNHENIVTIYDIVRSGGGTPCVVMELVDGQSMRQWANEPRGWREVVGLFKQVAKALAASHAAGVIHRDIKPANILVTNSGRALVADFGLARTPQPDTTPASPRFDDVADSLASRVVGTPLYMAPEQLAGKKATPEADQFSFFITLGEVLLGRKLLVGTTVDELGESGLRVARDLPRRDARVPRWLMRVLRKGLSAHPQERYASMEAVAAALEAPRLWPVAVPVVASALTAVVLIVWPSPERTRLCPLADERPLLEKRELLPLAAALGATGNERARVLLSGIERDLLSYSQEWRGAVKQVCSVSPIPNENDGRVMCLQDAAADVRTMMSLALQRRFSLDQFASVVAQFADIDSCITRAPSDKSDPLPRDPTLRAAAQAALDKLREAALLQESGNYDAADAAIQEGLSLVEPDVHWPTLAVLYVARLQLSSPTSETFLETSEKAMVAAERGGDRRLVAEILMEKARHCVIVEQSPGCLRFLRHARAIVDDLGDEELKASWLLSASGVYSSLGAMTKARDYSQQAYEYYDAHRERLPYNYLSAGSVFATMHISLKDFSSADTKQLAALYSRLIRFSTKRFGAAHPITDKVRLEFADDISAYDPNMSLRVLGELSEGFVEADKERTASFSQTMSEVLSQLGRHKEALQYARTAASVQSPDEIFARTEFAEKLFYAGKRKDSFREFEKIIDQKANRWNRMSLMMAAGLYSDVLVQAKRFKRAEEVVTLAISHAEASASEGSLSQFFYMTTYLARAAVFLHAGKVGDAAAEIARHRERWDDQAAGETLMWIRNELEGRVLWQQGKRDRGLEQLSAAWAAGSEVAEQFYEPFDLAWYKKRPGLVSEIERNLGRSVEILHGR